MLLLENRIGVKNVLVYLIVEKSPAHYETQGKLCLKAFCGFNLVNNYKIYFSLRVFVKKNNWLCGAIFWTVEISTEKKNSTSTTLSLK